MSPEDRKLLEKTYELVKENNAIIRKMRSIQRAGNWLRIGYWLLIIALSLGAFYFLQPLIESVSGISNQVQDSLKSVNEFREFLR